MRTYLIPSKAHFGPIFLLAISMGYWACDAQNTPLDAATRIRIDSISSAQIGRLQIKYDSLCKAAETTQLPFLVDSIQKIRLKRIQEQLKTIPR